MITIFGDEADYIWYNSKGEALPFDKELFELCQDYYVHEILDQYGLVARSLEFKKER